MPSCDIPGIMIAINRKSTTSTKSIVIGILSDYTINHGYLTKISNSCAAGWRGSQRIVIDYLKRNIIGHCCIFKLTNVGTYQRAGRGSRAFDTPVLICWHVCIYARNSEDIRSDIEIHLEQTS